MKENHQSRIESLGKSVYEGARVLHDFFEILRYDGAVNPCDLADDLARESELTDNQRMNLDITAFRAERAQGIVKYLGQRFGLNESGEFEDPHGLYSLLFEGKCPKYLDARSHNLAIEFVKGRWQNRRGALAHVNKDRTCFDQLSVPLEDTISRLEDGKSTNAAVLSFSMPNLKRLEKTAKIVHDRFPAEYKLFGPNVNQLAEQIRNELVSHELRHLFDGIMGARFYPFIEFTADLYAVSPNPQVVGLGKKATAGLTRDLRRSRKDFESRIECSRNIGKKAEEVVEKTENPAIRDHMTQYIEAAKRRLENIDKDQRRIEEAGESMRDSLKLIDPKNYPLVSYALSAVGEDKAPEKFAKRLKLLSESIPQSELDLIARGRIKQRKESL